MKHVQAKLSFRMFLTGQFFAEDLSQITRYVKFSGFRRDQLEYKGSQDAHGAG